MTRRRVVRIEELLGRRVCAEGGRAIGRIEDIRIKRRGETYEVTEYLLGSGALFERLAIVPRWLRRPANKIVVRWDQLDVSQPAAPRLLCAPEELAHE